MSPAHYLSSSNREISEKSLFAAQSIFSTILKVAPMLLSAYGATSFQTLPFSLKQRICCHSASLSVVTEKILIRAQSSFSHFSKISLGESI
jgi:hypothetical protein